MGIKVQKHLQQVLVLLSEVLQARLGLCLVGCQVHNKALERPISLPVQLCKCQPVNFPAQSQLANAQLGRPKWCRAMQCTALQKASELEAFMKGTLRRSSSFMPGPKLFARWAARARASARATSLAAFAEATSTDCRILHRQRPSVARMVHQHNVCRWQAGIAGL